MFGKSKQEKKEIKQEYADMMKQLKDIVKNFEEQKKDVLKEVKANQHITPELIKDIEDILDAAEQVGSIKEQLKNLGKKIDSL